MPPMHSNSKPNLLHTNYCSTIYSTSTSGTDISSSPAVSSRVLYHESFGRPKTSKSLPPPREEARESSPLPNSRSHHHTNSAEEYTTSKTTDNRKNKSTESNWPLGQNMKNSKDNNNNKKMHRDDVSKMTGAITSEEEFDALPIAVQRKYFSTLERLRFAQSGSSLASSEQDRHINELHHNSQWDRPYTQSSSLAERRGLNSRVSIINTGRRSASISHIGSSKPRRLKKAAHHPNSFSPTSPDTPDSPRTWFMTLPEKIQQSQFSREEQIALAGRLKEGRGNRGRESVILDAADEAIWKASYHRPANWIKKKESEQFRGSPLPESLRSSMDSVHGIDGDENVVKDNGLDREGETNDTYNPYDSFRWLDEESELDLRLHNHLDDYHANLSDTVPSPISNRRPSFRRHLSISKLPFGGNANARNSLSSPTSPIAWAAPPTKHEAKRSRALSLLPAKHSHSNSGKNDVGGYHEDSATSYWQDPDARLKLRVYLASPQKFDEAIEFGFPSLERDYVSSSQTDKENRSPFGRKESREFSRRHGEAGNHPIATTFLNDEDDLVFGEEEDDASMIDPDSPKTPLESGDTYNPPRQRSLTSNSNSHVRYQSKGGSSNSGSARVSKERNGDERDYSHLGITKPMLHKRADTDGFLGMVSNESRTGMTYMQQPVGPGNREMTLKMTLTRPDLRTDVPPPVPEKDKPKPMERANTYGSYKETVPGTGHSLGSGKGLGNGNLGWARAITETTITAGKPLDEDWEEKCDGGMKGPFGGADGWGPEKGDGGVVKRFWKRVKSQKRT